MDTESGALLTSKQSKVHVMYKFIEHIHTNMNIIQTSKHTEWFFHHVY